MRVLSDAQALKMGFSADKRKRRRQHRSAARDLLRSGGFFNRQSVPGTTFWSVAQWHRGQARSLKR
jgi:hypothetical protein